MNATLVPPNAIPGDRLVYFQEHKDTYDAEYQELFSKEVSVDLLNYMTKLPIASDGSGDKVDVINIRAVFEHLKSTITTKVVRGHSVGSGRDEVEFSFEKASVAANRTTGFDEPRTTTGPSEEGDKQENVIEALIYDGAKVFTVPGNASKKALNVGIQGTLAYPQSDLKYSVSMWIWNSGMIRIVLGFKPNTAKHTKTLMGTSEMMTVAPTRYETILKDAFLLLWKVSASRGILPAKLQQIGDPADLPWTVLNMSVTSALRRPWISNLDYTRFKVIYSLLLDSRISTEEYNEGILITVRHDRMTSNDSYFMIYLYFAQFSDLFESHQEHTLIDRDAGRYKINFFKLNTKHWKIEGSKSQIPKELKGREPIRQAIFNTSDHTLRIRQKDIPKTKNGSSAAHDVVLHLKTDDLPKFTIKFYQSGTVQMNSTTAFPWYNMWRGMALVSRGLTKTGISRRLQKLANEEQTAFEWVPAFEHKPIVDVTKELASPPPRKGVQDTLGRRGRKTSSTCKGKMVPQPEGSEFQGHCKELGEGYIVMPNKFGHACCAKYSAKNTKKVVDAYRRAKKPIPPHVAEELGLPAGGPVVNGDGNGNSSGGHAHEAYIVDFHPQKGLLRINGRTSGHNMPVLDGAAKQLGIALQYKNKGQIRTKDKRELMRDIAGHVLRTKGLPRLSETTRDAAIQHIMAMVLPSMPRELDQMAFSDKAKHLMDYVREHYGGASLNDNNSKNNNKNSSRVRLVTSPLYQDDEFSPATRRQRLLPPNNKNDSNTNNLHNNGRYEDRLTFAHKQYLVLDALFGFSSYDIPRFPTIKT